MPWLDVVVNRCFRCGSAYPLGTSHSCAPVQYGYPEPPPLSSDERIAHALERIAVALELLLSPDAP